MSTASLPLPEFVDDEQRQYLTFRVGRDLFGVATRYVREILEFHAITQVPMMPPLVRGVINLRGAVVPIIDLAERFSLGSTEKITYGMLNEMCAIRSRPKSPTLIFSNELTNANSIINVMPVTRSGFTIGSCETDSTAVRARFRMELIPLAAAVPMIVATRLEISAISMVSTIAGPAVRSVNTAP